MYGHYIGTLFISSAGEHVFFSRVWPIVLYKALLPVLTIPFGLECNNHSHYLFKIISNRSEMIVRRDLFLAYLMKQYMGGWRNGDSTEWRQAMDVRECATVRPSLLYFVFQHYPNQSFWSYVLYALTGGQAPRTLPKQSDPNNHTSMAVAIPSPYDK